MNYENRIKVLTEEVIRLTPTVIEQVNQHIQTDDDQELEQIKEKWENIRDKIDGFVQKQLDLFIHTSNDTLDQLDHLMISVKKFQMQINQQREEQQEQTMCVNLFNELVNIVVKTLCLVCIRQQSKNTNKRLNN